MDNNRQQTALALQPNLIEIVLDLAVDAKIVNQKMGICGQRLLVQTNMAIRIHIHDRENMVALCDKLACQRSGAVRQIQQYPLILPFFLQTCLLYTSPSPRDCS